MTCIVGLVEDRHVYLGGDSAAVGGYDINIVKHPKVFQVDKSILIGYTSSFRMGQLLQHKLKLPIMSSDVYEYVCCDLVDAFRDCFKDGGYAKKKDEEETGGFFLVGIKGRLFKIQSDYSAIEYSRGFDAVGCGEPFALGSLYSSSGPAIDKIRKALETAECFSAGVQRPFTIIRDDGINWTFN